MLFDPDRWPGPQNMYPPEDPERPVPWWREPMIWLFGRSEWRRPSSPSSTYWVDPSTTVWRNRSIAFTAPGLGDHRQADSWPSAFRIQLPRDEIQIYRGPDGRWPGKDFASWGSAPSRPAPDNMEEWGLAGEPEALMTPLCLSDPDQPLSGLIARGGRKGTEGAYVCVQAWRGAD
jgi:hypothetical protein